MLWNLLVKCYADENPYFIEVFFFIQMSVKNMIVMVPDLPSEAEPLSMALERGSVFERFWMGRDLDPDPGAESAVPPNTAPHQLGGPWQVP